MGYETAAATLLLATHCACCGRPLVDATSVEVGIGPICRKKYFDVSELPEGVRQAANKITHHLAVVCGSKDPEAIFSDLTALAELDLPSIVAKVESRLIRVTVRREGNTYKVRAPYCKGAVPAWRKVGQWQGKEAGYRVHVTRRKALWTLLCDHYAGETAKAGDYFTIPSQEAA